MERESLVRAIVVSALLCIFVVLPLTLFGPQLAYEAGAAAARIVNALFSGG